MKPSAPALPYVALLLLALAVTPLFAQEAQPTPAVAGTYHGSLISSGTLIPVVTHFKTDPTGTILGEYVMQEGENSEESGTLTDFKWESSHVVTCTWKDKYGSGTLRLLFSPDRSLFRGLWGPAPDSTDLIWDGIRVDSPAKEDDKGPAPERSPGTGLSISNPTA